MRPVFSNEVLLQEASTLNTSDLIYVSNLDYHFACQHSIGEKRGNQWDEEIWQRMRARPFRTERGNRRAMVPVSSIKKAPLSPGAFFFHSHGFFFSSLFSFFL